MWKLGPQIAGVWYAETKSYGSSWGEIFFTVCKNKSVVHGTGDEVFSRLERYAQILTVVFAKYLQRYN